MQNSEIRLLYEPYGDFTMNTHHGGNNAPRSRASLSQSTRHRLILAARKQTGEHLNRLMGKLFEHLDDAYFEPADVLSSDLVGTRFIYSIRELRQLSESVSDTFVRQVQKNLDRFFATESGAVSKKQDMLHQLDRKPALLALMNHIELEEDLAVLTVIAKGEQRYRNPLQLLSGLWASFTGDEVTTNSKNPVTAAPIAARLNNRFSLDFRSRNQTNRYINPIVKHAVAAKVQRIVSKLKII